jgi:hypothetical protein
LRRWDDERRLFREGVASLRHPIDRWGYEEVGEVAELGSAVTKIRPGEIIWGWWDVHLGEYVAVFGQGVPGLIVSQLVRLNGGTVIAVDGVAKRLKLAEERGAAHVIDFTKQSPAEEIRDLTENRGADEEYDLGETIRRAEGHLAHVHLADSTASNLARVTRTSPGPLERCTTPGSTATWQWSAASEATPGRSSPRSCSTCGRGWGRRNRV